MTKTSTMTHEAISTALCENAPLSDDQRAALLSLIARDKQEQAERDTLVDRLKAEAKELKAFLRSRDAGIVEQNRQLNHFRVLCAGQADELERLRAQVAPAVDGSPCQYAIDAGGNLYRRYAAPVCAGCVPAEKAADKWESARVADFNAGWNACRAAMLAAPVQQAPSLTVGAEPVAQPLSRFDAIERAMDLASLMGGSIGRNDRDSTNHYRAQLREHLIAYIPAAAQPAAQGVGNTSETA